MTSPTADVLDRAAALFGVLATPVRLRIVQALCGGEQNVTDLLTGIASSQPNMSRHLHVLYQSGVLAKRRAGQHIFYRIADDAVVGICKAVCQVVAAVPQSGGAGAKRV